MRLQLSTNLTIWAHSMLVSPPNRIFKIPAHQSNFSSSRLHVHIRGFHSLRSLYSQCGTFAINNAYNVLQVITDCHMDQFQTQFFNAAAGHKLIWGMRLRAFIAPWLGLLFTSLAVTNPVPLQFTCTRSWDGLLGAFQFTASWVLPNSTILREAIREFSTIVKLVPLETESERQLLIRDVGITPFNSKVHCL